MTSREVWPKRRQAGALQGVESYTSTNNRIVTLRPAAPVTSRRGLADGAQHALQGDDPKLEAAIVLWRGHQLVALLRIQPTACGLE